MMILSSFTGELLPASIFFPITVSHHVCQHCMVVKNVSPGSLSSLQMSFVNLGKSLKMCALVIFSVKEKNLRT